MSARFVPRPEILSILWMALYLTILLKADVTPGLIWILPLIQVLWVNTHGLFILGPIILVAYLAERLLATWQRARWEPPVGPRRGPRGPGRFCMRGEPLRTARRLFPLELLPKITAWGGLYKSYIIEFGDLRELVHRQGAQAMHGLYLRTECFLLWAIPPSFIVPAVWRASPPGVRSNVLHVTALGAALALCAASVAGSGAPGNPEWLAWLGRLAAPAMAALGILGAALLVRSSRRAASAAFMGGLAEAAWILWVRLHLFGTEPGPAQWLGAINVSAGILGWVMALLMVLTGALIVARAVACSCCSSRAYPAISRCRRSAI